MLTTQSPGFICATRCSQYLCGELVARTPPQKHKEHEGCTEKKFRSGRTLDRIHTCWWQKFHENKIADSRRAKSYEPRVIVKWSKRMNDETDPCQQTANQRCEYRAPVPTSRVSVFTLRAVEVSEFESLLTDEPIVGD